MLQEFKIFKVIIAPTLIAIVASIVGKVLAGSVEALTHVVYSIRLICIFVAGYLIVKLAHGNLWDAFLGGVVVFVFEFLIFHSIYFLIAGYPLAARGVIISFLLFVTVAGVIGLLGGLFARFRFRAVS